MSDDVSIEAEAAAVEESSLAPRQPYEPLLDQHEIDALVGYSPGEQAPAPGLRAMLDAGAGPREALPMLPVVFGETVRRLGDSLRELFGGDAEASLTSLSTLRYGDIVEEIVLPAQVATFRAEGWDGCGLVAMGPDFACLVLDSLLGAGRSLSNGRVASRPFSAIERAILTRLADAVLREAETAFTELAPVRFVRDRVEADPRLAQIALPGDVAASARITLTLEGRAATLLFVLPLATLEPVRAIFRQSFAGAKQGRDLYWAGHLATEIWQASIEAEAVLHECALPLRRVLDLGIGDTLMFDMKPTDLVEVRCGGLSLTRGRIGRMEGRIAVQIVEPVRAMRRSGPEASLA
ncbi:FliM/FliN family flagellar motor switch protein [uncultured Enterovirga sp.]|uniref:FliM/FliN family flagellar motor switch protein n=1 Tax=uncultured Enterovirga sp. TaxID=2026352 RepID=UPI0035CAF270